MMEGPALGPGFTGGMEGMRIVRPVVPSGSPAADSESDREGPGSLTGPGSLRVHARRASGGHSVPPPPLPPPVAARSSLTPSIRRGTGDSDLPSHDSGLAAVAGQERLGSRPGF